MGRVATLSGFSALIPREVPETVPGTITDLLFNSNRKPILPISFSRACFPAMTPGRHPAMGW